GIQPGHNKVGLLDSGVMLLIDGDAQGRPMFNLLGPKAGKTVYSFTGMPGAAGAGLPFKIGPGGEWIMVQAGGTDPHIRIIYLTGKSRDKIIRFDDEVNQQQFTPDNSKLLAGVWENEVVMIDMATGKRLWTTKTGIGPRILFSSDYKFVLVTTFLGQVHYLNAKNGDILWSKDLNAAEAVPGLHGKLAKWLDENTKEALESGHNINGGWNNIKKDVFYVP
ncbi:MAG: hypothetical protein QGD94_08755, partial [Planctomycetia bacterium]|nr:hypothetical protein [Planctomycetia bacterium]